MSPGEDYQPATHSRAGLAAKGKSLRLGENVGSTLHISGPDDQGQRDQQVDPLGPFRRSDLRQPGDSARRNPSTTTTTRLRRPLLETRGRQPRYSADETGHVWL